MFDGVLPEEEPILSIEEADLCSPCSCLCVLPKTRNAYTTDISFAEDHWMSNNLWREQQKIRDLFFLFSTDECLATELDVYESCS